MAFKSYTAETEKHLETLRNARVAKVQMACEKGHQQEVEKVKAAFDHLLPLVGSLIVDDQNTVLLAAAFTPELRLGAAFHAGRFDPDLYDFHLSEYMDDIRYLIWKGRETGDEWQPVIVALQSAAVRNVRLPKSLAKMFAWESDGNYSQARPGTLNRRLRYPFA